MLRIPMPERDHWQERAIEFGFHFHTLYGERYWDESAYYQFTLQQIEQDIEAPTEALHEMCLQVVAMVVGDDALMRRFCIPEPHWALVRESWQRQDPSLYSRLDFAYDGQSPAKLYENNADTPTSLYETGFWQWLWLEDQVNAGRLPRQADQFNSLQERLVNRFRELRAANPGQRLHLSCCQGTEEDRGTVQYLEDCAREAGLECKFVYVEEIGLGECGGYTDVDDEVIEWMFKLYPWEFMFQEAYGGALFEAETRWLEPPWKAILSNKALLPMLWRLYPGHPNLLPAFFEDELSYAEAHYPLVKKPLFSREGANVSVLKGPGDSLYESPGPYGEEGFIYQAAHMLPRFGDNYTLIGSWLVDDLPAGISVREDLSPITQDLSRYLPHTIIG